jgi:predicted nuclease of predicted toxin-antitoxin system
MDVHVPSAITEGLRRKGVDVLTSQEDGTRQADDESLLERATGLARILVTQDEDLLAIAAQWQASGREFAGLVFARQSGTSSGQ